MTSSLGRQWCRNLELTEHRTQPAPSKHSENKERAYIAASRRRDRSIEARVQSAMMASAEHRQRTGRSLRITEEIVRNEEMYEEEEDVNPRCFRRSQAHLPAGSPQADSYPHRTSLIDEGVDAKLRRQLDVDREFEAVFGSALSALPPSYPLLFPQQPLGQVNPEPSYYPSYRARTQSAPIAAPYPRVSSVLDQRLPGPLAVRHGSFGEHVPPLTPGSTNTDTPSPRESPPKLPESELFSPHTLPATFFGGSPLTMQYIQEPLTSLAGPHGAEEFEPSIFSDGSMFSNPFPVEDGAFTDYYGNTSVDGNIMLKVRNNGPLKFGDSNDVPIPSLEPPAHLDDSSGLGTFLPSANHVVGAVSDDTTWQEDRTVSTGSNRGSEDDWDMDRYIQYSGVESKGEQG